MNKFSLIILFMIKTAKNMTLFIVFIAKTRILMISFAFNDPYYRLDFNSFKYSMSMASIQRSQWVLITLLVFLVVFASSENIKQNHDRFGFRYSDKSIDMEGKVDNQESVNIHEKNNVRGSNYTFEESQLNGNLMVTSKYALIGQNNQVGPVLKKLNFETMKLQTIKYAPVPDWFSLYPPILTDMKNGDIAYGAGFHLFILDNETLEIKQIFEKYEPIDDVGSLLTYINSKTKESKYIFGRGINTFLMSEYTRNSSGKYTYEYRFNTPNSVGRPFIMTLTGMNSAVTVGSYFCEISYWNNLNSIVSLSYDHKYYMKNRQKVAVSYDQTFFVARNDSGFYEFYSFDEKYQTTPKSSLFISYNEHRKGMITSDDKNLFVSMSNPRNKHQIVKVDISASQFTVVIDQQGSSDNQIDFNLFQAKYNRFITLSVRNTNNYYLQLRAIDTLTILNEYQLHFNFTVLEYKLVGNSEWGLSFALAVRTLPSYYDLQNDAKLFLFKIEEDKIVSQNLTPPNVTYSTLEPCFTYILSYKARFPTIKVYHYSNLSLVTEIQALSTYQNYLNVEKYIFILSQYQTNAVFDLKQSFSTKGWFYKANGPSFDAAFSQIFPKRGLLYESPINTWYDLEIMKKVYNISSPAVTSTITLQSEYGCNSQTYYIPPDGDSKCNYYLYIEFDHHVYTKHPQLVRYEECSKAKQSYPIEAFPEEVYANIKISTDKKYVTILVCEWVSNNCLIEIRPFASLQKIIFHEFHEFDRSKFRSLDQVNIDLVDDKMLLIKAPYILEVKFLESRKVKDRVAIQER